MKDLKIYAKGVEDQASKQIDEIMKSPAFKDEKVRIMPDVHAGKGCVIGFTSTMGDKVIPNVVGVDIGCGMLTVPLGQADIDLKRLDEVIKLYIPSGANVHDSVAWNSLKAELFMYWYDLIHIQSLMQKLHCIKNIKNLDRIERSLGTLGGGNHFIEVGVDSKGEKYLIIHTGSRNLGSQVASYYQDLAIKQKNERFSAKKERLINKYKESDRESELQSEIIKLQQEFASNNDLCYLEGEHKYMYLNDMATCQEYASLNRGIILHMIVNKMGMQNRCKLGFHTIHNYISLKDNIVRKGAISAQKDEKLLIPINMRDGCILGVGKGNDDWNQSAPHGAGRIMSRTQAKKEIKLDEFKDTMSGIYSTSIKSNTIDEAPMAYKSMDDIVSQISDTVEVIDIIKPIYNFKHS